MKISKLLFLICFITRPIYGQFFNDGQDPSSIKWRQINSEHFKVIFSSDFEAEANRLVNLLEYAHKLSGNTLHQNIKKIPILIHNYSVESDGLTVWAPKRIEIFPVSPQDIYPEDWFEQLSLHELRHVAQLEKINQGTTKFLGYFFGQQAAGGISFFAQPWLLEGDAVTTETVLSNAGRGRLPSFSMEYKAQLLEQNKLFSFQKAFLGSYKDYVPDYYQLGYQIVSYNRYIYGASLWENVFTDIGKKPYTFFPVALSLKNQTGLNKKTLYKRTFQALDSIWTSQLKNITTFNYKRINTRVGKDYTSYRYPQVINDSTIVAIKSSMDDFTRIVTINTKNGKEKNLVIQGISLDNTLSANSNYIVWSEEVPHPRWENKNYSIIRIYDIKKRKTRHLTHKTRYFSPAISPAENKIAVIEVDEKNNNFLVILDAITGHVLQKNQSPGNYALQTPSWSKNKDFLVMTSVTKDGKSILSFDINSQNWETLLEAGSANISQPVIDRDYVYFNSGLSGIDNIYALNIQSHNIYQVSFSKFGSFDPFLEVNNEIIYFSNYTSQGFDIVSVTLDTLKWKLLNNFKNFSNFIVDTLCKQEPFKFPYNASSSVNYSSKKYNKLSNLFNVHSWAPFYTDFNNLPLAPYSVSPGFTVLSQNILGTATTIGGLEFNNNQIISHLSASYEGFLPIIDFSANYGKNYFLKNSSTETLNPPTTLIFNSKIYVPIYLNRNYYQSGIIPTIGISYVRDTIKYFKGYSYLEYNFFAYRYTLQTTRDIYPKLGETIEIDNISSPDKSNYFSNTSSLKSVLYLPGILNHHSLRITGGIEYSTDKKYYFPGLLSLPRGYYEYDNNNLKIIDGFSIDYAFPIAYPDLSVFQSLYFKRFRGNFFYDYTATEKITTNIHGDLKSSGFEFSTDFHLFSIPFPFAITYRLSYDINYRNWDNSFLIYMYPNF